MTEQDNLDTIDDGEVKALQPIETPGDLQVRKDVDPAELLEKNLAAIGLLADYNEKIVATAIRFTRPTNWTKWGGRGAAKFRIDANAAKTLMSKFGINEYQNGYQQERNGDGSYTIYMYCKYRMNLGIPIEASYMGSCRSDDDFVSWGSYYDEKLHKRVKKRLTPEEVHKDDVIKAAWANCRVNAVSGILGLAGLDEEFLANAGLDMSKVETVSFGGFKVSEKQRKTLSNMGATEAEIDACKKRDDVDALFDKHKGGKHKKPSGSKKGAAKTQPDPKEAPNTEINKNEAAKEGALQMIENKADAVGFDYDWLQDEAEKLYGTRALLNLTLEQMRDFYKHIETEGERGG